MTDDQGVSGPTNGAMVVALKILRSIFGDDTELDNAAVEQTALAIDAHTHAIRTENAALRERLRLAVEAVALAKRSVRTLDCGHHYCRYCNAKSPEWKHAEACSYVQSEKDVRAFQEKADALRASGVDI